MNGLHIVAELYDCRCDTALLCSADALRDLCLAVCNVPGLTPLAEAFHQFKASDDTDAGATGAVILAESHLTAHTWPETFSVALDIYLCDFTQDNRMIARAAYDKLVRAFAPARAARREIERGRLAAPRHDGPVAGTLAQ